MKKLSIITINYNDVKGLRATQKSIAEQTFRDFEWLVVDGESTDGSKGFLAEHEAETAWCCSEPDGGIYNAMNKGIQHADGEYLLFLNSGDTLFEATTLERVFSKTPDADVVYGDWKEIQPLRFPKMRHAPKHVSYYYFATRPLCHQAAFIRASLLKQAPYDETYAICADWAKWVELSRDGRSFLHLPVTVCNYRRDGISYHAKEQLREEHRRILYAFYNRDEAEVFETLSGKLDRRLSAIRRLVWTVTFLLLALVVFLVWALIKS